MTTWVLRKREPVVRSASGVTLRGSPTSNIHDHHHGQAAGFGRLSTFPTMASESTGRFQRSEQGEAQPTLLFVPDISGFTRFVNETEISHSRHIIAELLETLIDANRARADGLRSGGGRHPVLPSWRGPHSR